MATKKSTSEAALKKGRQAVLSLVITSREQLEDIAAKATELQLARDAMIIQRDLDVLQLENERNTQIKAANEELAQLVASMESWSLRHRKEAFGEAKTLELAAGDLCFHNSPGKVGTEKGFNQEIVVEALCAIEGEQEAWANSFLHVKTTLNKDAILDRWDTDKDALAELGLKVTKDEQFSYRPKRTALGSHREKGEKREVAA